MIEYGDDCYLLGDARCCPCPARAGAGPARADLETLWGGGGIEHVSSPSSQGGVVPGYLHDLRLGHLSA